VEKTHVWIQFLFVLLIFLLFLLHRLRSIGSLFSLTSVDSSLFFTTLEFPIHKKINDLTTKPNWHVRLGNHLARNRVLMRPRGGCSVLRRSHIRGVSIRESKSTSGG
jgi:hypothetical protein